MPAIRYTQSSSRRRRSSVANLAQGMSSIKAGQYGVRSPKAVTFAPNVTPTNYTEDAKSYLPSDMDPAAFQAQLFPVVDGDKPKAKKRATPSRKRSVGHIPRPANAFMLFRANFVKEKHLPGDLETNNRSLSKIIGNCWRVLPLEEKAYWEMQAAHAKAVHKAAHPEYKFKPSQTKKKQEEETTVKVKKEKRVLTAEEERRLEDVAQLLVDGKRGSALTSAVHELHRARTASQSPMPAPSRSPVLHVPYQRQQRFHRRSSSVPPPSQYQHTPIAVPALPFFSPSRPPSPTRSYLGMRRPSSAQPMPSRPWHDEFDPHAGLQMTGEPMFLQRDPSPLPEADTSLWNQDFLNAGSFGQQQPEGAFSVHGLLESLGPYADGGISPLDAFGGAHPELTISIPGAYAPGLDPLSAWSQASAATSAYSGSPTPSEAMLHHQHQGEHVVLQAPMPQHAAGWAQPDFACQDMGMHAPLDPYAGHPMDMGMACGDMYAQGMYDPNAYVNLDGTEHHDGSMPPNGTYAF